MALQYTTENGRPVQLGRQLGKGGEGIVYEVPSHPGLVAKIYQPRPEQQTNPHLFTSFLQQSHDKLRAMIAASPKDPNLTHTSIAWPKHILLSNGSYVGFLMPLIDLAHSDKIYNFCHPRARKKEHPSFTRKHAFHTAANFANAVRLVHSCGHVVGDMNHANILCQENGLVTLIDTDSFAITDPSGRFFPCTVAMPEYLAPEVQGCTDLATLKWQSFHDFFALGVHVFQLLFNRHPFDGILRGGAVASKPVNLYLIENGVFPYAQNRFADPPQKSGALFSRLSPAMQQAFITTFHDGSKNPQHRLIPADWTKLLTSEENSLVQCLICGDWNEPHLADCSTCGQSVHAVGSQNPVVAPHNANRPVGQGFNRQAAPPPRSTFLSPVGKLIRNHPKSSATACLVLAGFWFLPGMKGGTKEKPDAKTIIEEGGVGNDGTTNSSGGHVSNSLQPNIVNETSVQKIVSLQEVAKDAVSQPLELAVNEAHKFLADVVTCNVKINGYKQRKARIPQREKSLLNEDDRVIVQQYETAISAKEAEIVERVESYFVQLNHISSNFRNQIPALEKRLAVRDLSDPKIWGLVSRHLALVSGGSSLTSKEVIRDVQELSN